jgi:hypothetical protein
MLENEKHKRSIGKAYYARMRNFRHYATGKSSKLAGNLPAICPGVTAKGCPGGIALDTTWILSEFCFILSFSGSGFRFRIRSPFPDMDEEQKDEPDRQAHDTPGGQAEGGPDRQAGTEQITR